MQVELCCTVYFKSLSSLSSYNQFGREEKETLNFAKSHTLHAQDREREKTRRVNVFLFYFSPFTGGKRNIKKRKEKADVSRKNGSDRKGLLGC